MPSFPEILVSNRTTATAVSKAVAAGQLRRLASRLYTTNLAEAPETFVRRNLWTIVAAFFPGALIADRTALELRPASDGSVFLITDGGGDVALPGIRLRPRRGHGALADDYPFREGLRCSSQARALLENMRPSRGRSGSPRTLPRAALEERLDTLLRTSGENALGRLRDQVRAVAPALGMATEAVALDALIGTLLGTRDAPLASERGRARRRGEPFDPSRVERFELLHDELRRRAPAPPRSLPLDAAAARTQAFFEAYFSNFIEGTEFEVAEAAAIVFDGAVPAARPADAHDVLGTFAVVSDPAEMTRVATDAAGFEALLRRRHATIMAGRPETSPGSFKTLPNRAGSTFFVAPGEVRGTLRRGFDLYRRLSLPLDRAIFVMFLVAEVHPFADGNGRLARIMMNADLATAGEARIIIPTIYRANYLSALRALSLNNAPDALIRTLDFAQRWVRAVPWKALDETVGVLELTGAFMQPAEADEQGIRLRIPAEGDLEPR